MKVTFWGTRGSIAKAGHSTLRFGGNTSCVSVRSDAGTQIVIDCGTGAHGLGQELVAEAGGAAIDGHILISHTHWDHIQGLPFFAPLFQAGNRWELYGPSGLDGSLSEILAGQMEYRYFPVAIDQLSADVHHHDLVEGTFDIHDVRVDTQYLNHPALTLGYRLEVDGATVVYASDHEPHDQSLASGGDVTQNRHDEAHARFVAGADLLIHDAQYSHRSTAITSGGATAPSSTWSTSLGAPASLGWRCTTTTRIAPTATRRAGRSELAPMPLRAGTAVRSSRPRKAWSSNSRSDVVRRATPTIDARAARCHLGPRAALTSVVGFARLTRDCRGSRRRGAG